MKISNFREELIPRAPAPSQKLENTAPAQLLHLPRGVQLLLPQMPLHSFIFPISCSSLFPSLFSSIRSLNLDIWSEQLLQIDSFRWKSQLFPLLNLSFPLCEGCGGICRALTESQGKENSIKKIKSSTRESSSFPNRQIP